MFIKQKYRLQTVAGKSFIFLRKDNEVDMTRILSFNNSSVWLWKQLEGKEFTQEDALLILIGHYEGDIELMKLDLDGWIDSLIKEEIIEE